MQTLLIAEVKMGIRSLFCLRGRLILLEKLLLFAFNGTPGELANISLIHLRIDKKTHPNTVLLHFPQVP